MCCYIESSRVYDVTQTDSPFHFSFKKASSTVLSQPYFSIFSGSMSACQRKWRWYGQFVQENWYSFDTIWSVLLWYFVLHWQWSLQQKYEGYSSGEWIHFEWIYYTSSGQHRYVLSFHLLSVPNVQRYLEMIIYMCHMFICIGVCAQWQGWGWVGAASMEFHKIQFFRKIIGKNVTILSVSPSSSLVKKFQPPPQKK